MYGGGIDFALDLPAKSEINLKSRGPCVARILYISNDADPRPVVEVLAGVGHDVRAASDWFAEAETRTGVRPDLILIRLMPPTRTFLSTILRLRSDNSALPIAVWSDSPLTADLIDLLDRCGITRFFYSPSLASLPGLVIALLRVNPPRPSTGSTAMIL